MSAGRKSLTTGTQRSSRTLPGGDAGLVVDRLPVHRDQADLYSDLFDRFGDAIGVYGAKLPVQPAELASGRRRSFHHLQQLRPQSARVSESCMAEQLQPRCDLAWRNMYDGHIDAVGGSPAHHTGHVQRLRRNPQHCLPEQKTQPTTNS
jgi:hypothetical protein